MRPIPFADELTAYFGVFTVDMAGWAERGYDYTKNQVRLYYVVNVFIGDLCFLCGTSSFGQVMRETLSLQNCKRLRQREMKSSQRRLLLPLVTLGGAFPLD